jgi:hypothetical protein
MSLKTICLALICAATLATPASAAPHKRALLIGINDYTAAHLARQATAAERDWTNLSGAVNDAESMREMLVLLHDFAPGDIVTLTDQAATREAILHAIETHLIAQAAAGDIVFFYYAGHGSQVRNTQSDEPDQLDESIVPADSRRGAPDIRDKELRRLFNRILDRGARLTVMLDDCHSGSGARGLPAGNVVRGIKPDLRDVADGSNGGPRPEHRGALVLSASQDFEMAGETLDREDQKMRGVFTWAWMRAMRDASPGESAFDTFLRAQARLRAEMPYQEPVIAATASTRQTPFLGARDVRAERAVAAVVKIRPGGSLQLHGGWANGFSVGTELRSPRDPRVRITITALVGLGESEARIDEGHVEGGALLRPVDWVAAPARPLHFCVPRVPWSELPIAGIAHLLRIVAARRDIRWINDPTLTTPDQVLRRRAGHWELVARAGVRSFSGEDGGAEDAVNSIAAGSSLFVQLPASAALADQLMIAPRDITSNPADADYILSGRYTNRRLTYAWVRPGVTREDRRKCGVPVRSAWVNDAETLRDTAVRLQRIVAWQSIDSPPVSRSQYHLALRRDRDQTLVRGSRLAGRERYRAVLRGQNLPPRVDGRFSYVFVVDSQGESKLLYPYTASGSVENRFPIDPDSPPEEIPLARFEVSPPYGIDTYFLLTTDQPLANPSILEWSAVRQPSAKPSTSLERFLASVGGETRGPVVTTSHWSIERTTWESTPPKRGAGV